jgi:eukaryotic-like serine/threonine-protein kinase
MPSPSNVPEFLVVLRQSGLVAEPALARFVQVHRAALAQASSPFQLAKLLVSAGLLTPFQAEQLLQGKWRRFEIGRYVIMEQLGAGGMATVYLCQHKHMKRKAALKVLPWRMAADPSSLARFYREARAVAALDHPNVVRAYDVAEEDGLHFIAMEYVEGSTLYEMVKVRGPLGTLQAMHYMRQTAAGLQHAYEKKLIHRDLKPSNLLVDLSGTVKILDLGLARFFTDDKDDLSVKFDDAVLGTADYLAPEAAVNCRNADIRSDIYGLGCTLYFCLTGRPPFPDGTVAQKLLCHQTKQPQPIHSLRPDLPKELVAVIGKMMAKEPRNRFQTPAELADVLGRLLAQSGETAVGGMQQTLKESSRWRKRQATQWRRWVLAVGLALLAGGLSLFVLLIGWLARGRKENTPRPARSDRDNPPIHGDEIVQL